MNEMLHHVALAINLSEGPNQETARAAVGAIWPHVAKAVESSQSLL